MLSFSDQSGQLLPCSNCIVLQLIDFHHGFLVAVTGKELVGPTCCDNSLLDEFICCNNIKNF